MYSKEEKKQLTEKFWAGFTLYCSRLPFLEGKEKKWMLRNTKVRDVHFKFDPGRDGVKVMLEILHNNEDERLEQYERIEKYKVILEEGFEEGLIWDFAHTREEGKDVCRIYVEKTGLDWHRLGDWEEIYAFMAENMSKLEENYIEIWDLIR